MTTSNEIVIQRHNGVMQIAINRPDKKNALTTQMYDEMRNAVESAIDDNEIRVVLFYGTKSVFSAGNDLSDFNDDDFKGPLPAMKLLNTLHLFDKPIVAAVSGIAVGIGATLLLHCDLVYASTTRFRMPFVSLGLCPEAGSSLLLPKLAGHRKAAEILMLGDYFDTKTAIDIGLVSAEVSENEVLDYAISKAEKLAKMPVNPLKITKHLMKKAEHMLLIEHMQEEYNYFSELLTLPECKKIIGSVTKKS